MEAEKKRALFIDRDGTLIVEPPVDFQVDSLEKLELMPAHCAPCTLSQDICLMSL